VVGYDVTQLPMTTIPSTAMRRPAFITWKDLFQAILLGVLLGWLLIAAKNPSHPRFEFDLSSTEEAARLASSFK
jgi:hypothetical protein